MASATYYGSDEADLSTVDANPSIYSGSDLSAADQISQIGGAVTQWGATIASVVTGNPVATTPTGTVVGAAGSTTVGQPMSSQTKTLLVIGVVLVLAIVLMEKSK